MLSFYIQGSPFHCTKSHTSLCQFDCMQQKSDSSKLMNKRLFFSHATQSLKQVWECQSAINAQASICSFAQLLLGCGPHAQGCHSSPSSKQKGDTEATQRKGLDSYQESKFFLELPDIFQLHFICQHCIKWLPLTASEAEKSNLFTLYWLIQTKQGSVNKREVKNAYC